MSFASTFYQSRIAADRAEVSDAYVKRLNVETYVDAPWELYPGKDVLNISSFLTDKDSRMDEEDDSPDIQSAINSCYGKILYFPPGTYTLKSPVYVQQKIYLMGHPQTIFNVQGLAGIFVGYPEETVGNNFLQEAAPDRFEVFPQSGHNQFITATPVTDLTRDDLVIFRSGYTGHEDYTITASEVTKKGNYGYKVEIQEIKDLGPPVTGDETVIEGRYVYETTQNFLFNFGPVDFVGDPTIYYPTGKKLFTVNDVTIENIQFVGAAPAFKNLVDLDVYNVGIVAKQCRNLTIKNCQFSQFVTRGVRISLSYDCTVDSCTFTKNWGQKQLGTNSDQSVGLQVDDASRLCKILKCNFDKNFAHVQVGKTYDEETQALTTIDTYIEDCTFKPCVDINLDGTGFGVGGAAVRIAIEAKLTRLFNNKFLGNDIHVETYGSYTRLHNNRFVGSWIGILIQGGFDSSSDGVHDTVINDNFFVDYRRAGIFAMASGTTSGPGAPILYNRIENIGIKNNNFTHSRNFMSDRTSEVDINASWVDIFVMGLTSWNSFHQNLNLKTLPKTWWSDAYNQSVQYNSSKNNAAQSMLNVRISQNSIDNEIPETMNNAVMVLTGRDVTIHNNTFTGSDYRHITAHKIIRVGIMRNNSTTDINLGLDHKYLVRNCESTIIVDNSITLAKGTVQNTEVSTIRVLEGFLEDNRSHVCVSRNTIVNEPGNLCIYITATNENDFIGPANGLHGIICVDNIFMNCDYTLGVSSNSISVDVTEASAALITPNYYSNSTGAF